MTGGRIKAARTASKMTATIAAPPGRSAIQPSKPIQRCRLDGRISIEVYLYNVEDGPQAFTHSRSLSFPVADNGGVVRPWHRLGDRACPNDARVALAHRSQWHSCSRENTAGCAGVHRGQSLCRKGALVPGPARHRLRGTPERRNVGRLLHRTLRTGNYACEPASYRA